MNTYETDLYNKFLKILSTLTFLTNRAGTSYVTQCHRMSMGVFRKLERIPTDDITEEILETHIEKVEEYLEKVHDYMDRNDRGWGEYNE
jgi:hypothetical protein